MEAFAKTRSGSICQVGMNCCDGVLHVLKYEMGTFGQNGHVFGKMGAKWAILGQNGHVPH